MQLYNREWTRRELEARVGRLEQVGGIRRFTLNEGLEAGVEQVQVRTGAGLAFYVSPARGLDISLAEFCGSALSWQAANGDVHPAYFDDTGLAWLRTAAGGLLMTCGFTQMGAPNVDQGQVLGLHGRAHHLPARQVAAEGRWRGDEYRMRVAGVVEESIVFGDHIRMTREIGASLGSNRVTLTDVFENIGFAPAPLTLLYHFNFGYPLMDEQTVVLFPSRKVVPREDDTPLEGYTTWQAPTPGHRERVYLHEDLITDQNGWTTATIHNPTFPLGAGVAPVPLTVRLAWSTVTLPGLGTMAHAGCGRVCAGDRADERQRARRAASRADGSLVTLAPGASQQDGVGIVGDGWADQPDPDYERSYGMQALVWEGPRMMNLREVAEPQRGTRRGVDPRERFRHLRVGIGRLFGPQLAAQAAADHGPRVFGRDRGAWRAGRCDQTGVASG